MRFPQASLSTLFRHSALLAGLILGALASSPLFTPAESARAESGDLLSTGQNGFVASRWHNWFCLTDEVCKTGDINGDGADDIAAFSRSTGIVTTALSRGATGAFTPSTIASRSFCSGAAACELADIDGDGRADLVSFYPYRGGEMAYSLFDGTTFRPALTHREPYCTPNAVCTMADVNGDSFADVVVFARGTTSSPDGRVWVSLAMRICSPGLRWTDSSGHMYSTPASCTMTFAAPTVWHSWFCIGNETCKTGDLNADGRDDLIAFTHGDRGDVWTALASTTAPRFEAAAWRLNNLCTGEAVCDIGDFNGDGRDDLVSFTQRYTGFDDFRPRTPGGDVFVSLAQPDLADTDGVRFGPVTIRMSDFCITREVCGTGDFNADGKDDLIAFSRTLTTTTPGDVFVALSDFGKQTSWQLSADRLSLIHSEEGSDEPYLEVITFRATVGVAGSTTVSVRRVMGGSIPTTLATFEHVELPTVGELFSGAPLEVMGSIIIALESDATPWGVIDDVMSDVRAAVQRELVRVIERGNVLTLALNPGRLQSDLASAESNIRAAVQPSDSEAVGIWLKSWTDPDDLIGIHVYAYVAVDKEVAPMLALRMDRTVTSGVPGETVGATGTVVNTFQCLEAGCRVSPSVRYDLTTTMRALTAR